MDFKDGGLCLIFAFHPPTRRGQPEKRFITTATKRVLPYSATREEEEACTSLSVFVV